MPDKIKILITGDFYAGGRIENLIQAGNYAEIFNDFLPIIKHNDIAITNLESAVTEADNTLSKTGPAIKSSPKTVEALKFAGFNTVTLANNHIMDYGVTGLNDTIQHCIKNDIQYLGAGNNYDEASKIQFISKQDKKLAFINIAENEWSTTHGKEPGANPLDPVSNFYTIQTAKQKADYVFVIIHGGHEMHSLPSLQMKKTYRFFVDAGASAVIGHHTHCVSGFEMYKNSPIFYSLGNFIFDNPHYRNSKWNYGMAVQFSIKHNGLTFKLFPYEQCNKIPGSFLLTNDKLYEFNIEFDRLSKIIEDNNLLTKEFDNYCRSVSRSYNAFLEPLSNKYLHALQNRGLFPSLLRDRKRKLLLNLIRCEAHRDVVMRLLKP